MKKHWTNSKFADWVRGTPILRSGTSEEWNAWRETAKVKAIRYWIAEEFLEKSQNIITYIPDRVNDIRYWLNNRYLTGTHALTSSTLKRGKWHELGDRMLFCLFDEFVNFIEIDKAWMHVVFNEEIHNKYNVPWWRKHWYTRWFKQWRCSEAGIDHLKWEMSLTFNEEWIDKADPNYNQPTLQALAAKWQYDAYNWWKFVRPTRIDPYEESGWNIYCAQKQNENFEDWVFTTEQNEEERVNIQLMLGSMNNLEEQYFQEDTKWLKELIEHRQSLWT